MYEITENFKGSPDPSRVLDYVKGQTYEIGDDFSQELADVAVAENWAVKLDAKKPAAKKVVKKKKPAAKK